MSSYEMMKQELPAYGQPGGYQHQPAPYMQLPNANMNNGQHANEVQHHDEPPPRRGSRHGCGGDDSDDEGSDEDVLGPGELPDKALNVCMYDQSQQQCYLISSWFNTILKS